MLFCSHNLVMSTQTIFCNAMLTILISRLRLYLAMLCCSHHLDISTETVFCNAMLIQFWYLDESCFCNALPPTPSWYFDIDNILHCFAAYTILTPRLRLYFGMLCLQNLDISTETVPCNAMLPTQYWYLDWDCILQCYAAYTILISRLRLYFAKKNNNNQTRKKQK